MSESPFMEIFNKLWGPGGRFSRRYELTDDIKANEGDGDPDLNFPPIDGLPDYGPISHAPPAVLDSGMATLEVLGWRYTITKDRELQVSTSRFMAFPDSEGRTSATHLMSPGLTKLLAALIEYSNEEKSYGLTDATRRLHSTRVPETIGVTQWRD